MPLVGHTQKKTINQDLLINNLVIRNEEMKEKLTCTSTACSSTLKTLLLQDEAGTDECTTSIFNPQFSLV